jgi:hypothetical protein
MNAPRWIPALEAAVPKLWFTVESFDAARLKWRELIASDARARIYHGERWLEVLARAYGFRFMVAQLRDGDALSAACVMAETRLPFARGLVALPFSDDCSPLARDDDARATLLAVLAGDRPARNIEIRGIDAAPPWQLAECFLGWELNLARPAARGFDGLAGNFRYNLRRARNAGVRVERGNSRRHLARFFALHSASRLRHGVPCQPLGFFETVLDVFGDDASIWCASSAGRDLAAMFVLSDGDRLYAKWSARDPRDRQGAGHQVVWSIIEEFSLRGAAIDLGRTDVRNDGLNRFKRETGADSTPLPYAYLPRAPRHVSSEVPEGLGAVAARAWRHLPHPLRRRIESAIFPYLA